MSFFTQLVLFKNSSTESFNPNIVGSALMAGGVGVSMAFLFAPQIDKMLKKIGKK